MSLTPGTRLGSYEVTALIGQGGMGEVYKAKDTRMDRTVAIKVLPAHVADDPDLRQRFERLEPLPPWGRPWRPREGKVLSIEAEQERREQAEQQRVAALEKDKPGA